MSVTTIAPGRGSSPAQNKVTVQSVQEKKQKHLPLTCLTAYDYPTARLVDEATPPVDMILVGDSLAMVVLGHENTLAVTMEEMLHHTRAARRGVKRALLIADMPYGAYHTSAKEAVRNAVRFVKEAGAEAVKLEGGGKRAELVERLRDAEIPVMGHIGLTPQSLNAMGGFKVQGRSLAEIERLIEDALALEAAGIFSLVLEGVPREVAALITGKLSVPTIGIGAGPECDGQVLVLHDLLNLTFTPPAKFARRFGDVGKEIAEAVSRFTSEVEVGSFPGDAESYHLPAEVREKLEAMTTRRVAAR